MDVRGNSNFPNVFGCVHVGIDSGGFISQCGQLAESDWE